MSEERIYKKLEIENGEIMPPAYRNFAGVPYGQSSGSGGRRTFCIRLDRGDISYGGEPLVVDDLIDDRWKVKFRAPRDEGDDPTPFLEVVVNFDSNRPPRIVVETSRNRVLYDEEMIDALDSAEIVGVDAIINPYNNNNGTTTAYLQALYVTIEEDRFASKHPLD